MSRLSDRARIRERKIIIDFYPECLNQGKWCVSMKDYCVLGGGACEQMSVTLRSKIAWLSREKKCCRLATHFWQPQCHFSTFSSFLWASSSFCIYRPYNWRISRWEMQAILPVKWPLYNDLRPVLPLPHPSWPILHLH